MHTEIFRLARSLDLSFPALMKLARDIAGDRDLDSVYALTPFHLLELCLFLTAVTAAKAQGRPVSFVAPLPFVTDPITAIELAIELGMPARKAILHAGRTHVAARKVS